MHKYLKSGWKFTLVAGALLGIFFYWHWANGWKSKVYHVASGQPGAGYHSIVEGLLEISKKKDIAIRMKEVPSDGSVENARLVVNGVAQFGLIQLGGEVNDDLRAVTHVYDDVLHILKRNDDDMSRISGFKGKKIASGLPGSGTRVVAMQLLQHYGLSSKDVSMVDSNPEDSVQMLIDGKVDAVIMVTSAQAPVISL